MFSMFRSALLKGAINYLSVTTLFNVERFCHRAIPGQYRGLQHGCHVLDTADFRHLLLLYSHR